MLGNDNAPTKSNGAMPLLRFEEYEEGMCAQTLHIGPFSEEVQAIQRVHDFINEAGIRHAKHHEITSVTKDALHRPNGKRLFANP
jgi:hypothetical protein